MRMKKRSDDLIISQILDICESGARKTRIVYQANLNSTTINRYLECLIETGMIEQSNHGASYLFKTTVKGAELKNRLSRLQTEMDELRTAVLNVQA
ncbi:MAG: winged helix-turn-helix domain-containing protein [Methanotrichaceae archaeon]